MNFQMGNAGVSKFKKLKAAIEDYDFDTAAKEIMNSKYAKQTNSRAKANAKKIKNWTLFVPNSERINLLYNQNIWDQICER